MKKSIAVKSSVIEKLIKFNDYFKCLNTMVQQKREQRNIHSRLHVVHTKKQTKIAPSPLDEKRFLIENSTDILPWGHYCIIKEQRVPTCKEQEHTQDDDNDIIDDRFAEPFVADNNLVVMGEQCTDNWFVKPFVADVVEGEQLDDDGFVEPMKGESSVNRCCSPRVFKKLAGRNQII